MQKIKTSVKTVMAVFTTGCTFPCSPSRPELRDRVSVVTIRKGRLGVMYPPGPTRIHPLCTGTVWDTHIKGSPSEQSLVAHFHLQERICLRAHVLSLSFSLFLSLSPPLSLSLSLSREILPVQCVARMVKMKHTLFFIVRPIQIYERNTGFLTCLLYTSDAADDC